MTPAERALEAIDVLAGALTHASELAPLDVVAIRRRLFNQIEACDRILATRVDRTICVCATGSSACPVHESTTLSQRSENACARGWPDEVLLVPAGAVRLDDAAVQGAATRDPRGQRKAR